MGGSEARDESADTEDCGIGFAVSAHAALLIRSPLLQSRTLFSRVKQR